MDLVAVEALPLRLAPVAHLRVVDGEDPILRSPPAQAGTSSALSSKSWPISSRSSLAAEATGSACASSGSCSTARSARSASLGDARQERLAPRGPRAPVAVGLLARPRVVELQVALKRVGSLAVLAKDGVEQLPYAASDERDRVLSGRSPEHRRRVDGLLDGFLEQAELAGERERALATASIRHPLASPINTNARTPAG